MHSTINHQIPALFAPATVLSLALAACGPKDTTRQPVDARPTAPQIAVEPAEPRSSEAFEVVITTESEDPEGADVSYGYAWTNDAAEKTQLSEPTVPAEATEKGQTWRVSVRATDGERESKPAEATVTVRNTPPTAEVTLTPGEPTTTDALEADVSTEDFDGDDVSVDYTWYRDGDRVEGIEEPTVPADRTAQNEVWKVEATPNDGSDDGETVSATVRIGNSAPKVTSLSVTPEDPTETSTLKAEVETEDPDGDEVDVRWRWLVDETAVEGVETSELDGEHFDKGDEVRARAVPDDGFTDGEPTTSDPVTIQNTPPSLQTAFLEPTPIHEKTTVTCKTTGWADPDDADTKGVNCSWKVDGQTLGLGSTNTLTGQNFDRGQTVQCIATPTDGDTTGNPVKSSKVTVQNTAPEIGTVVLNPAKPTATDAITASVSSRKDPDGDSIQLNYAWHVNQTVVMNSGASLPASALTGGDTVFVEVTPTDGTDTGTPRTSNKVSVQNTPPSVTSIQLTPQKVYTDTTIQARIMTADPDGDAVQLRLDWLVNGSKVLGNDPKLAGIHSFDKGDTVQLKVTPSDGKATGMPATSRTVTVLNSPPYRPKVKVAPSPARPDDHVGCTARGPADPDPNDTVTWSYEWSSGSTTRSGTSPLPPSATSAGETWTCTVIANDGQADSPPGTETVKIVNGAPTAPTVTVQPTDPKANEALNCAISKRSSDPDGDKITYGYVWKQNGTKTTFTKASVPASATSIGDTWTCQVTAEDPYGASATASASASVGPPLGATRSNPAKNCLAIHNKRPNAPDGAYWLKQGTTFETWCDMTRDGGGWTLVGKVAAGDYSNLSDRQYIDLIANPVDDVNASELTSGTKIPDGTIAFLNRRHTNGLWRDAKSPVVRVDLKQVLAWKNNGADKHEGTYFQSIANAPQNWDFWHALRNAKMWGTSTRNDLVEVFGTDFTLDKGPAAYDPTTGAATHGGDGSFHFWHTDTYTVKGGGNLTVTKHMGLLCDGYSKDTSRGELWLLTSSRKDSRWKDDSRTSQKSLIWVR